MDFTVVLNCDCGEGIGDDEAIMPHIGAANIACGAHAGDVATMRATVRLAVKYGVAIGAHPGYPDRDNFGRKVLPLSLQDVTSTVSAQVSLLQTMCEGEGATLTHVKPHGALYNHAAIQRDVADAIAIGIAQVSRKLIMVGLAGSQLLAAGKATGLRVMAEAFADRAYEADGSLRSRTLPGALIEDDQQCVAQCVSIVTRNEVTAFDGTRVPIHAGTLCIHSDTPGAAVRAALLHTQLPQRGIHLITLAA